MNLKTFEGKFTPEPYTGCWLWTRGVNSRGYGQHCGYLAHRVAWILYRGSIPQGKCVLHKCDTPMCVNPDHLFIGTQKENNSDRAAKGRSFHPTGIKHPRVKLTEQQVKSIRNDPRSHRQIALAFGIDRSHSHKIKTRKLWKHL